jgi:uncharacterized membrane protein
MSLLRSKLIAMNPEAPQADAAKPSPSHRSIATTRKERLRAILAISMVVVGIIHFVVPDPFVKIVPDYLPYHLELVYISGFFEILGGIGLLVPPVSQAAAWGLILLFIAVFPANINMAVNAIDLPNIPDSDLLRWGRLPLQAVLIAWAWWYTKTDSLENRVSLIPARLAKSLTQDLR